jgi:uncharacterized Tic20 family protein
LGEKWAMENPIPALSGEDRLWGALAHLSAFAMYFTGIGHIVGPMIIWLWKRDTNSFVASEAKEAMNFNISVSIYALVALVLCLIFIGIPLLIALHSFQVICIIIAALKASDGRSFRYPLNLRLV